MFKKFFSLFLILLFVLTCAACSRKNPNEEVVAVPDTQPTTNNASSTKPSETTTPTITLPENILTFVPDEGVVVYSESGITIKYYGQEFTNTEYDNYMFSVENKTSKDISLFNSTLAINNLSLDGSSVYHVVKSGATNDVILTADARTRKNVCQTETDINCLTFILDIVEIDETGDYSNIIKSDVAITIEPNNHSHLNDKHITYGNLKYEDECIALYIGKSKKSTIDVDKFAYTVINKTNKTVFFDLYCTEYKIAETDENRTSSNIIGASQYIAPNSYSIGDFTVTDIKYKTPEWFKVKITAEETTKYNRRIDPVVKPLSPTHDKTVEITFNELNY